MRSVDTHGAAAPVFAAFAATDPGGAAMLAPGIVTIF
jgi:hypothetical protein